MRVTSYSNKTQSMKKRSLITTAAALCASALTAIPSTNAFAPQPSVMGAPSSSADCVGVFGRTEHLAHTTRCSPHSVACTECGQRSVSCTRSAVRANTSTKCATMLVGVTLADDRQRHADEWWWVEMAALTARRVVDMIAELSQRPLVQPGGPWRWGSVWV